MRGVRMLVALVQATTVVAAAGDPVGGDIERAGFVCGYASGNDFLGMIDDGDRQHGVLECGPWIAADVLAEPDSTPPAIDDDPAMAQIAIHSWIQVNNDTPVHEADSSAHCHFSGTGVAGGACVIEYHLLYEDSAYLCSTITMTLGGVTETYWDDADHNESNGIQCLGGDFDIGAAAR